MLYAPVADGTEQTIESQFCSIFCVFRFFLNNFINLVLARLPEVEHSHFDLERELLSCIALMNECVEKAVSEPINLNDIFSQFHRTM